MKFEDSSWREKRYLVIKEVLKEAGYSTIRADEITTSGPIVDEVCTLLQESDLVVIDSSGDSHSVSYEIGFCHGIKRSHEKTILIRKDDGSALPFNFRHYRIQFYKDLKHLKRLLREWFSITIPILPDQNGYCFVFRIKNEGIYGSVVAKSIITALSSMDFDGRCEYYAGDHRILPNHYIVSLGLKFKNNKTPDHQFWKKLRARITLDENLNKDLAFVDVLSEYASIREISSYESRGIVEFSNGSPDRVIHDSESWFIGEVKEVMRLSGK